MDELKEALAISLSGQLADDAIARCRRHLRDWGVSVPPVEPLILDFGLDDFANVGLIEYWVANEAAAGYCGKYLFVFRGQTCPLHRHKKKKETFFVVKGAIRVTYGENEMILSEGDLLPVEPGTYHSFSGDNGPALLLELSSPCEIADNDFADKRIPIGRD